MKRSKSILWLSIFQITILLLLSAHIFASRIPVDMAESHRSVLKGYGVEDFSTESLIGLLDHEERSVKVFSALLLGETQERSAIPRLEEVLQSESEPAVRVYIAEALLRMDNRKGVPVLKRIVEDSNRDNDESTVRLSKLAAAYIRALLTLAEAGETFALQYLREEIQDERGFGNRITAVRGLMLLYEKEPSVLADIVEATATDYAPLRSWAKGSIVALERDKGFKEHLTGVEHVVGLLKHERAGVRAAAADFLGQYEVESAVDQLERSLQDESPAVRVSAGRALVKMGNKKPVPVMKQIAQGPGTADEAEDEIPIQAQALDVLAQAGQAWAIPHLTEIVQDSQNNRQTRILAINGLRELYEKDPSTVANALNSIRRDEDIRVAGTALRALVQLGELKIPTSEKDNEHDCADVRAEAADFLKESGHN